MFLGAIMVLWGQRAAWSLATAVALAALAFMLFRLAEHDLSPQMKALARRGSPRRRQALGVRSRSPLDRRRCRCTVGSRGRWCGEGPSTRARDTALIVLLKSCALTVVIFGRYRINQGEGQ
jgi:hypothetical protein